MNSFRLSVLFAAALGFVLSGCEPHSFDDTKGLHMDHGGHHGGEGHGDHGADDHGKKDGHGEVEKEKAAAPAPEAPKGEPRATGI